MNQKSKLCQNCGGSGFIVTPDVPAEHRHLMDSQIDVRDCPECGGHGLAAREDHWWIDVGGG